MNKAEQFQFRLTTSDKRLAVKLAKVERRTLSNFIINLIHERADAYRGGVERKGFSIQTETVGANGEVP